MIYVNLLIIFANFWIWKILKENPIIGIALIIVNILLFLLTTKINKIILSLTLIFCLFLSSQILISGFDKNLSTLTVDGQKQQDTRHGYFSQDLGKLFQNKYALHFYKEAYPYLNTYLNNTFDNLSPNLYFFENHPREREKVGEFSKYPGIFILPFIVGFLLIFKSISKILVIYFLFAVLVSGFIRQNYFLGPVLFFPLINILISRGIIKTYKILRK